MIDTHAHLDNKQFDDDRYATLQRALDAGITKIIIPSIHPDNFDAVHRLADTYEQIFRGIGVHPHHAHEATHKVYDMIERQSEDEKVVAIGEIGIDYYYDFSPKETQKTVFREQLRIAKRTGLPAIIHNREADDDVVTIIEEEQDGTLKGVLHCFSSDLDVLQRALALGMLVSFTGNITYKKSVLGEVVLHTPLDKMMIETDAPYMAPVPHRGKRNEPVYVQYIAEKIAEIHNTSLAQVIAMTSQNAQSLFRFLICLLILTATIFVQDSSAQKKSANDEYDDRDEEVFETEKVLPKWWQNKNIGVSFSLSTNTIVETLTGLDTNNRFSTSFEGLFAFGGGVSYSLFDWLNVEGSYLYSRNTKVAEQQVDSNGNQLPNTHQSINLSVRTLANPYAKVNFFGTIGMSYLINRVWAGKSTDIRDINNYAPDDQLLLSVNQLGINVGAGFSINIPTSFGMFQPTAEWRLDFPFASDIRTIPVARDGVDQNGNIIPAPRKTFEVSTFYSLPRFTLYFYPQW
ncbi:MAG TPA: TatD family hydrolase [Candidatus Kapabacteria bacterium]|nr:TatD family hydrolase [Candidatus Kapabacteria bacterium]